MQIFGLVLDFINLHYFPISSIMLRKKPYYPPSVEIAKELEQTEVPKPLSIGILMKP